jgi:POT family proton-dependent oligopeptide transporter
MMDRYNLFGYMVDGQRMQAAGSILILILVPLMGVVGYPLMRKVGLPTSLSGKIMIGMLIAVVAFCISGGLQSYLDSGKKLSIMWQLAPYVPLEIAEVMVSVTALEFAYSRAPARMKSVVMGVWFAIVGTGNLSVALLTTLIGTSTVKSDGTIAAPADGRPFHLTPAAQFFFYAGLMLAGAVAFIVIDKLLLPERTTAETTAPIESE